MPIQKELVNGKIVTYKIKFINSVRFISISVPNVADNLAERLHKGEYNDFQSDPEYMTINNGLLVFNCVDWNKNCEKKSDEDLAKIFSQQIQIH